MIEPLLLKSAHHYPQERKNTVITAIQLIEKFNIKSPSNKICLTDRLPSTTKSITSSKITCQTDRDILAFKKKSNKIDNDKNIIKVQKSIKILEKKSNKNMKENNNCRQKIVKIMNEINKKEKKQEKINLPVFKLKNKENICLTQRSKSSNSTLHPLCLKTDINLQNIPLGPSTSKNTLNLVKQQKWFRKSSDASTLSLRSKHTTSMQHLQNDNDELFNLQKNIKNNKYGQNLLVSLQLIKKKLYSQIYSLDNKLLNHYPNQQICTQKHNKKSIIINLKRQSKQEYNTKQQNQL